MGIRYQLCDIFTDTPLEGNQLGVFEDARGLDIEQMQALARELNFSESTFVFPARAGGHAYVRIFTPGHELPFAGHPCLGTAFTVARRLGLDEVVLETAKGRVPVRFERCQARSGFGWMTQPRPTVGPFPAEADLLEALGIQRSELPIELYDNGVGHLFVCLGSEREVASLRPNLELLGRLGPVGVNCFAGAGGSWKTRMFAPGLGVAEDPATGSAAGPLAFHLVRHRRLELGGEIEIRQGAEVGRPSRLYARVLGGTAAAATIEVGGSVVLVASGEFNL
jgi:trans-2,3-dihydro-3-hydroxyanthranilate isomerase